LSFCKTYHKIWTFGIEKLPTGREVVEFYVKNNKVIIYGIVEWVTAVLFKIVGDFTSISFQLPSSLCECLKIGLITCTAQRLL
jgi:hypothetical protein